jgi:hypothetical protein
MGWVVFLVGCLLTVPVGWLLFTRTSADRFLSLVGITLLPPTVWSAALGLKIGSCKSTTCVTHSQRHLLLFAVAALVVLVLALAALAVERRIAGAALMTLAPVLTAVSTWKLDRVSTVMFGILAGAVAAYLVLALLPNRASPQPGYLSG